MRTGVPADPSTAAIRSEPKAASTQSSRSSRPTALYIESRDDVTPFFLFPSYDWIFITKTGTSDGPEEYRQDDLQHLGNLRAALSKHLGAAVSVAPMSLHAELEGRYLQVYRGHRILDRSSPACMAAISKVELLYMNNSELDREKEGELLRLCPALKNV